MSDFSQYPAPQQPVDPGLAPPPPAPAPDPYAGLAPDIRVPWKLADIGIFLLIYLGINIVVGIAVFGGAAVMLHKSFTALQNDPVVFPVIAVLAQVLISVATIFYFWILVRIRSAKPAAPATEGFWRTIGFRPLGVDGTSAGRVLLCLLAGVAVSIAVDVSSTFMGKQPPTSMDNLFQSRTGVLALMFFGVLVAPLVEEMMFRGFLYPVVARRLGIIASVLFTGAVFGAFHALQLWPAKGLIALLIGVGIIFTWVRARAKSVLASFLMHTAYNSTIFVALLIQTKGLTDLSQIH